MAEGVGFEPTVGFPTLDFESSALNRTQPPFPFAKKNVQYRASNASITQTIRSAAWLDLAWRVPSRAVPALADGVFGPHEAKKCNNFRLAMSGKFAASCMSTRTATLLLVVDRYSQVLGAAVHHYSQLIRKPQPLPYCHDSTQTRNSARVTE